MINWYFKNKFVVGRSDQNYFHWVLAVLLIKLFHVKARNNSL